MVLTPNVARLAHTAWAFILELESGGERPPKPEA
jgi:hypothetical protein